MDFKLNLEQILDKAKKLVKNVIFIGTGMVDELKTHPVSWDANFSYSNKDKKEYGCIAKSVCENVGVEFVEIWPELEKTGIEKVLDKDGVHFNAVGHKLIFQKVKTFLESKELV